MAVVLSPYAGAGAQFFDNAGNPLAGGKIYTYVAGTTTPAATYTDETGGTANANPIVLDSAGRVPQQIWLTAGSAYKFVLKTSADVTIKTDDDVFASSKIDTSLSGDQQVLYVNSSGVAQGDTTLLWDYNSKIFDINGVKISRGGGGVSTNTAIGGGGVLNFNSAGFFNTATGSAAMSGNTVGSLNCAFGGKALRTNSFGNSNSAFGLSALELNTSGNNNTAGGANCLATNSTGNSNTGWGHSALQTNSTGSFNAAFGSFSLNLATGSNNAAFGYQAGDSITTGSNNLVLGSNADASSPTVSNEITLGDANITSLRVPGLTLTAGAKWINNGTLTVATLPAAATAGAGARAVVTDANATTFAAIVAGGGANTVPVFSDGTNWRIG